MPASTSGRGCRWNDSAFTCVCERERARRRNTRTHTHTHTHTHLPSRSETEQVLVVGTLPASTSSRGCRRNDPALTCVCMREREREDRTPEAIERDIERTCLHFKDTHATVLKQMISHPRCWWWARSRVESADGTTLLYRALSHTHSLYRSLSLALSLLRSPSRSLARSLSLALTPAPTLLQ